MNTVLTLKPEQEISADQIVLVANGKLKVETEKGERVGILLPRTERVLLNNAVALGYLTYSAQQPRVTEVFCSWCDAKVIPYVSFEIRNDFRDILGTNDVLDEDDPFVIIHFNVFTAGIPFSKDGLMRVTEFLLGKLWNVALSPWKVCAGALPLTQARQIVSDVYSIWATTSEADSEGGFSSGQEMGTLASEIVQ